MPRGFREGSDSPAEPAVQAQQAGRHRGLTVREVARRYRVSPDKVRGWIRRGELSALNTSDRRCARPRFVVTPEALAEFEQARSAATPPNSPPRRRRRITGQIDFYPDP
jgi:excisionase family DNA binding protein